MQRYKVFMPKCKSCGEQLRFNGQDMLIVYVMLKADVTFKCKCGKSRTCNIINVEKENASSSS